MFKNSSTVTQKSRPRSRLNLMTKILCAGERSPAKTKDHISLVRSKGDENTLLNSYFTALGVPGKPVNHPSILIMWFFFIPKLYQRSILCFKQTPNKSVRSFLIQYKIRMQKEKIILKAGGWKRGGKKRKQKTRCSTTFFLTTCMHSSLTQKTLYYSLIITSNSDKKLKCYK